MATGELVEKATFSAYGSTESDYRPDRWGAFREDHRFTGKEEDIEVGLVYFGKRFYSANLNRWMSPDPLAVHDVGEADLNLYAYVEGRALYATDPLGLAYVPPPNAAAQALSDAQQEYWDRAGAAFDRGDYGTTIGEAFGWAALTLGPDFVLAMAGARGGGPKGGGRAPTVTPKPSVPKMSAPAAPRVTMKAAPRPAVKAAPKPAAKAAPKTAESKKELRRPYVRKATRKAVDDAAPRDASGRPLSPNTGRPIEGKPELGHKRGHEHRREKAKAEREGLTQKEFNDRMNDPKKYQLEPRDENRGHKYEKKP